MTLNLQTKSYGSGDEHRRLGALQTNLWLACRRLIAVLKLNHVTFDILRVLFSYLGQQSLSKTGQFDFILLGQFWCASIPDQFARIQTDGPERPVY